MRTRLADCGSWACWRRGRLAGWVREGLSPSAAGEADRAASVAVRADPITLALIAARLDLSRRRRERFFHRAAGEAC